MTFPLCIAQLIGEYTAEWKFEPWVTTKPFQPRSKLYANKHPMAFQLMDFSTLIQPNQSSFGERCWEKISENSAEWAADLIIANPSQIKDWYWVARNQNPRVFAFFNAKNFTEREIIDGEMHLMLTSNPLAVNLLIEKPQLIERAFLGWNPRANEVVKRVHVFDIVYQPQDLLQNKADWAVDILLANIEHLVTEYNINLLSANENPRIVDWLSKHPKFIDWKLFSQNPSAIDYLRANPQNVRRSIYANSAAIKALIPDGLINALMAFS